jgi:uncharacterized protein
MAVKNAMVVHNASNQRFEINIDGQLSILEYTFKNHRLFLTHTEVPPALESQGLGTELAHAALEYARQNELTVVVLCPFVKEYVGGHPAYQSFVHFGCLNPKTGLLRGGFMCPAGCSISILSLRTEYNTWRSNARNNFSGAIDGRPVLAYSLLKRGFNSRRASSAMIRSCRSGWS